MYRAYTVSCVDTAVLIDRGGLTNVLTEIFIGTQNKNVKISVYSMVCVKEYGRGGGVVMLYGKGKTS